MEKTAREKVVKIINGILFGIVIGTPLFYLSETVYPYLISKTSFFQGLTELLIFLYAALAVIDPRCRPKRTPLVTAILLFCAVLFITSMFGVDPSRSFWSMQDRVTG